MTKLNARVGAIKKADDDNVYLYGWGKYVGDEIPTRGWMKSAQIPNPCITLDNGKKVYGFECWWGPESRIKKMIGNRKIIEVPLQ